MRRKLLTLIAVAVVVGGMSQTALATNGDDMIGVSPVSRAMGGIGVGMSMCATDALYRNPAWMSKSKNFEVSFGSTLFLPDVKASATTPLGTTEVTSKADTFVIPEFSITQRINDKVVLGVGAFGVSGMGTDYRNSGSPLFQDMNTNFSFMRMMPAVSYKINDNLSLGAAFHLTWGSLDMGQGYSQDFGIGGNIGLAYETEMLSFGFSYMSPVSMTYKRVYDSNGDGVYEDMKLEQPQEVAAGVGVKPVDGLKLGFDVRWINWAGADGYKQFGWNNQVVYAVGAQYQATEALTLRAGFNYAKSPLDDVSAASNAAPTITVPDLAASFNEYQIGVMNALGFPAITETHITLGAGYKVNEHFTVNVAYVHAFEGDFKVTDTANAWPTYEAKNAQNSISMGLHWNF
ncbi:OmpP1/FadL family transporter [Desulfurobacterium sp.]